MNQRLNDLILLAEGMGWTRKVEPDRRFLWPLKPGQYCIYNDQIWIPEPDGDENESTWDPFNDLCHAGMLMRALAIVPVPVLDPNGGILGWEAARYGSGDRGGRFQNGNTETAQCVAICECSLKILRS